MLTLLDFGRRLGTTEKCLQLLLDTAVSQAGARSSAVRPLFPTATWASGLWQILPPVDLSGGSADRIRPATPDVGSVVCDPLHDWLGHYWSWNTRAGSKLKLLAKDPPLRTRRARNVGTGDIMRKGKEIFAPTLEKCKPWWRRQA
jgi:hypothetical protein